MQELADSRGNADRRRLTTLLHSAIAQGHYLDTAIPTDIELARDYGTSRGVARDALNALADTGLLTRIRGVGTHAEEHAGATFDLLAFHGIGGVPDMDTHPQALSTATVSTPALVATRLPQAGAQVLRIEFLSVPDGEPHGISTSYFVLPQAAGLVGAEVGTNIYSLLAAAGLTVSSSDFLLGAFGADEYTARRLRVRPGDALISLERTLFDESGDALAFTLIALRGDRFQLVSHERAR
ncbi:GntR family transcriptional regulator [Microbacterium saperdae]|uniref:GntR family transcriptional regulator n=1 Tax=Microbacterium saperdae TaxID=69368 RepID=A0A543BPU1_9MICO|nr:GntR family transcriptional regulator [Microbacterium saperdae]TQL86837.1 GntR family transcriptional regulator [Microbacterium saperdae]GGM45037.1 hypothetical protein GCM10010489_15120 [Microbacterium saperdae]